MGYRKPDTVISPKTRWVFGKTLCDTGQGGWSAAEGSWDAAPVVAVRWNGDDDSGQHGNPQSHGNPTWFIVPGELEDAVIKVAGKLNAAMSLVTCNIWKPADFTHGVYKVRLDISGKVEELTAAHQIIFDIPELPKRLFRASDNQRFMMPPTAPKQPWRGYFIDNSWEAIVQSNGVFEDDNPTAMDVVRDALVANVMQSIKPWMPPPPVEINTAHRI